MQKLLFIETQEKRDIFPKIWWHDIFCIIIIFSSQILVQNTFVIVVTFYLINKTINKELNNLE